jgi:hypothetical protein
VGASMRKSTRWPSCLLLAASFSAWSCAVDGRSPGTPADELSSGAGGSTSGPEGTGGIASSVSESEAAARCNGEQTCIDMLINANAANVSCPGCSLQGDCLAAGELNPDNPCQVCDPARDSASWSSNDDAPCDDGLFCTVEDICQAGVCAGSERQCENGIACDGVAVCLEDDDGCSPNENQCEGETLCDVVTDSCVTTCDGCAIDGVCLPAGMAATGNPCLICNPEASATSLSAAEGQPCGASEGECSAPDTCNAEGQCLPNHLESGAPCGAAVANDCDAADACDGNGQCVPRRAENGTSCEDGSFCTVGDQCQGSTCVGGGPRNCAANERCSDDDGSCVCAGCTIAGSCVAAGDLNPANSCLICDPARSVDAYSPNVDATCGSAATECSGQDTCNAQGQCTPNHLAAGTACGAPGGDQCDTGDSCDGSGQCVQRVARNGDPCDDGQFCTTGDTCQNGACRSGGPRSCGASQTCDEGADQCRCTGCVINGNCIAGGAVNPNNACQVCDPGQNAFGFVANAGASCGSSATQCSGQDTCNAQGLCQPNHLPQGTVCGSPASGQCDTADSCDGGGQCIARQAANGATCEDGLFCTQGDRCQNGSCVSGGPNCGSQGCDENANRCGAQNGQPCTVNADCLNGSCRTWFRDVDGDQFGSTTSTRVCGNTPPNGFVANGGDCCDQGNDLAVARQMNPGQQGFFTQGQTVCLNVDALDYNCSGAVEVGYHPALTTCSDLTLGQCLLDTAMVWGTDFDPGPDLCGFPAQISVCEPVGAQCMDLGEITFIAIPCR